MRLSIIIITSHIIANKNRIAIFFSIVINYKKKHYNYVDEYETEINDFDSFSKILNVYGFEETCCIEKTREKYLYKDKDEISFDDVKDLGIFMKIEIVKYTKK